MNKELTLPPICWAEDSRKQKAEAQERRMAGSPDRGGSARKGAAELDAAHRDELRRRERCDKIFDCFMMGAAGAMTACVVITALGLA